MIMAQVFTKASPRFKALFLPLLVLVSLKANAQTNHHSHPYSMRPEELKAAFEAATPLQYEQIGSDFTGTRFGLCKYSGPQTTNSQDSFAAASLTAVSNQLGRRFEVGTYYGSYRTFWMPQLVKDDLLIQEDYLAEINTIEKQVKDEQLDTAVVEYLLSQPALAPDKEDTVDGLLAKIRYEYTAKFHYVSPAGKRVVLENLSHPGLEGGKAVNYILPWPLHSTKKYQWDRPTWGIERTFDEGSDFLMMRQELRRTSEGLLIAGLYFGELRQSHSPGYDLAKIKDATSYYLGTCIFPETIKSQLR